MSGDFVLCVALPWFDLWYHSNHSVFHPLSGLSTTDWQSFGAESTLFLHICVVPNTKESQSAFSTVQTHNWKRSFFLWDFAISAKGQQRGTSNRWKTQVNSVLQLVCRKRRSWFALQNMAFAWFWRPSLKLSEHSTVGHFSMLFKWKQTNFMVELMWVFLRRFLLLINLHHGTSNWKWDLFGLFLFEQSSSSRTWYFVDGCLYLLSPRSNLKRDYPAVPRQPRSWTGRHVPAYHLNI